MQTDKHNLAAERVVVHYRQTQPKMWSWCVFFRGRSYWYIAPDSIVRC